MTDHLSTSAARRAAVSLTGLALGDAFGQQVFYIKPDEVLTHIERRLLAPAPWHWTDDTNMALSVLATLCSCGAIDQDALAADFAGRYDPRRGYGGGMIGLLTALSSGGDWRILAPAQFGGAGSFGNGAAMRIAPLGAWFAGDRERIIEQASASAEVTHTHPDAVTGAIAVAIAASLAVTTDLACDDFLAAVCESLPDGELLRRMQRTLGPCATASPREVAALVGSGQLVAAHDTVPFALWCASRQMDDLLDALWFTAAGLGDVDTTCAIVGGIVACRAGIDRMDADVMSRVERLPGFVSWILEYAER